MKSERVRHWEQETPLVRQVADLDENGALTTVRRRLADGDDPINIIYECEYGMRVVGKRYEEGHYYIAALIMAGEIFRQVVEIVKPHLVTQTSDETSGCILLGTVQGDIHDIGKDVLGMLLTCHGFTVHDLGVDVTPDRFVEAALEHKPDIMGLSGLLTAAYAGMKDTIAALREATADWSPSLKIIIGGGRIDEEICRYVGADYWTVDAMEGVHLCERLLMTKRQEAPDQLPT